MANTTSYLTSETDMWTPSFRPTGQGARTSVSEGTDGRNSISRSACTNHIHILLPRCFAMSSTVRLNVGGVLFFTRRSTLLQSNSFFSGLFASAELETEYLGTELEYFVDRDPTHFRHILNFIRGTVSFPSSKAGLNELLQEADFYSLHQFVVAIKQQKLIFERTSIEHYLSVIASGA